MLSLFFCVCIIWLRIASVVDSTDPQYSFNYGRCGLRKCLKSFQITVGNKDYVINKVQHEKKKQSEGTPIFFYDCRTDGDASFKTYVWLSGGDEDEPFLFVSGYKKDSARLSLTRQQLNERISFGHVVFEKSQIKALCGFFNQPDVSKKQTQDLSFSDSSASNGLRVIGFDPVAAHAPSSKRQFSTQLTIKKGCCLGVGHEGAYKTFVVTETDKSSLSLQDYVSGSSLKWDTEQFRDKCANNHVLFQGHKLHIESLRKACGIQKRPKPVAYFRINSGKLSSFHSFTLHGVKIYNVRDETVHSASYVNWFADYSTIYFNLFNPAISKEEWIAFKYSGDMKRKSPKGSIWSLEFVRDDPDSDEKLFFDWNKHLNENLGFETLVNLGKVSMDKEGNELVVKEDFDPNQYKQAKKLCVLKDGGEKKAIKVMVVDKESLLKKYEGARRGIFIQNIKASSFLNRNSFKTLLVEPNYCALYFKIDGDSWRPWYYIRDGEVYGEAKFASAALDAAGTVEIITVKIGELEKACEDKRCGLKYKIGFDHLSAAQKSDYADDLEEEEEIIYEEEEDLVRLLREMERLRERLKY